MVQKFRSKFDKHTQDDEKRKESLKRKFEEQLCKKEVIKNALSTSSLGVNKKIFFNEDVQKNESDVAREHGGNYGACPSNGTQDKLNLFDDSSNEEEKYEIKIKNKFEGKKGHKLLNLQSNYNNDDRFKLDERFYDDDNDDDDDDDDDDDEDCVDALNQGNDLKNFDNSELNNWEEEKARHFKILENVLGHPLQAKEKRSKRSFVEMVRFDASNEDHRRQEESDKDIEVVKVKKKKRLEKEERKKKKKEAIENETKVNPSSEEKFYKVSDDLRQALKSGKNESRQFSLLGAFARNDVVDESSESGPEPEKDESYESGPEPEKDESFTVEKDVAVEKPEENKVEATKVQGIRKEKFFFSKDDPRIEEGLNFINMKDSEEAKRVLENYDTARRGIREVLRLRWQKHRQRNNPFKKKIGGSGKNNAQFNKSRKFFGKSTGSRQKR